MKPVPLRRDGGLFFTAKCANRATGPQHSYPASQRGSAMKILVRENTASLRATDERLLLACGANMVIPWNAPLSRCLTMIESVQGQKFSRYVPEDITTCCQ